VPATSNATAIIPAGGNGTSHNRLHNTRSIGTAHFIYLDAASKRETSPRTLIKGHLDTTQMARAHTATCPSASGSACAAFSAVSRKQAGTGSSNTAAAAYNCAPSAVVKTNMCEIGGDGFAGRESDIRNGMP